MRLLCGTIREKEVHGLHIDWAATSSCKHEGSDAKLVLAIDKLRPVSIVRFHQCAQFLDRSSVSQKRMQSAVSR